MWWLVWKTIGESCHWVLLTELSQLYWWHTIPARLLALTASRCRRAYILPLWFLLLFLTPDLRGHWTDLNQTWTHSFMTAIWKIWSELTPTGWGKKTIFGTDFDRTYLCNGTRYQQSERNLSIHGDSLHASFDPETSENGWWVFAHHLNFRIGRHCQPYRMDVI